MLCVIIMASRIFRLQNSECPSDQKIFKTFFLLFFAATKLQWNFFALKMKT